MIGGLEVVALGGDAAASGLTYPLPGGERTAIHALAFTLACSGGGAARQVVARLDAGTGGIVYAVAAPGVQASGETVVYSFAPLVPSFGSGALGYMGGPFPPGLLPPNLSVVVEVVAAGGADVLSAAALLVRQEQIGG